MNGLPLRAWRALTPQQVDIIAHAGILSVEQLADATDSLIAIIKLPNPKDLRTLAQRQAERGVLGDRAAAEHRREKR